MEPNKAPKIPSIKVSTDVVEEMQEHFQIFDYPKGANTKAPEDEKPKRYRGY